MANQKLYMMDDGLEKSPEDFDRINAVVFHPTLISPSYSALCIKLL